MLRRSSNVAAVALALVLGVADTFKERGQDNALVAPIATQAVVDRLRIVTEADDWPAADRTDLHRRHGARSVKRGRGRGPARVGLSRTEDKLRGELSLTVARPGAKPGAHPLSRFGACAGLAIPRQSFARRRQSGARSERPRCCREPSVGGFGIRRMTRGPEAKIVRSYIVGTSVFGIGEANSPN